MTRPQDGKNSAVPIRVAVVTGHHPFDVPEFHGMFRRLNGVDAYIQHLEDFVSASPETRAGYDCILFYNMHMETPGAETDWWDKSTLPVLEQLGKTTQGIFLLHHAILAYRQWRFWADVVGIPDRRFTSYHIDQSIHVEIADPQHPITQGLAPWDMIDETYLMEDVDDPNHPLLTTKHPNSMSTLAWIRTFGNARVFCLQCGHDNQAYSNPNFQQVVERGLLWCAGKL